MTRDEAQAVCDERNRDEREGHWLAQESAPGEWRAVRLTAPGLTPARPEGTATEARPRPSQSDDARPGPFRNTPPFGGAL